MSEVETLLEKMVLEIDGSDICFKCTNYDVTTWSGCRDLGLAFYHRVKNKVVACSSYKGIFVGEAEPISKGVMISENNGIIVKMSFKPNRIAELRCSRCGTKIEDDYYPQLCDCCIWEIEEDCGDLGEDDYLEGDII